MARPKPSKRAIAGIFPFIFALLAFTFSLLAVTSPEWASRDHYPDTTDKYSQRDPIYTLFRSPFQICIATGVPVEDPPSTANSTTSTNSTTTSEDDEPDNQPPPDIPLIWTTTCTHYHLYGLNKTSCELPSTIGPNALTSNAGDARQCQQIHLSANYLVASAVFLGVAMFATLILFVTNLSDSIKYRSKSTENGTSHLEHIHHFPKILTILPTILNPLVITGIITALISQFYAIQGLIQSAPNNGDWTTSTGNREHHDPWVQGRALSTYMSLSWFWALLAGWSSWLLWGAYSRRNLSSVFASTDKEVGHGHGQGEEVKVK